MTKQTSIVLCLIISVIAIVIACNQPSSTSNSPTSSGTDSMSTAPKYGGFLNQAKRGENLVSFSGCNDCHNPKKKRPPRTQPDNRFILFEHPPQMPAPP